MALTSSVSDSLARVVPAIGTILQQYNLSVIDMEPPPEQMKAKSAEIQAMLVRENLASLERIKPIHMGTHSCNRFGQGCLDLLKQKSQRALLNFHFGIWTKIARGEGGQTKIKSIVRFFQAGTVNKHENTDGQHVWDIWTLKAVWGMMYTHSALASCTSAGCGTRWTTPSASRSTRRAQSCSSTFSWSTTLGGSLRASLLRTSEGGSVWSARNTSGK